MLESEDGDEKMDDEFEKVFNNNNYTQVQENRQPTMPRPPTLPRTTDSFNRMSKLRMSNQGANEGQNETYVNGGVKLYLQRLGPFEHDRKLSQSLGNVQKFDTRVLADQSRYLGEWS